MTLRPCLDCGEPSPETRCDACHPPDTRPGRPDPASIGYDAAWVRLSKRARRLQPFCSDCGTTEDLTTDHSVEAWKRKAAGKSIRLADVAVCCRACNSRRGPARHLIHEITHGREPSPRPPPSPSSGEVSVTVPRLTADYASSGMQ